MKKKLEIISIPIEINRIKPKDCIGLVFKNKEDVYNIPNNIEDILKSHQWFDNIPQQIFIVSNETIKKNDRFISKTFLGNYTHLIADSIPEDGKKLIAAYPKIDNVPTLSKEFLQKWCHNAVNEIEVEYEHDPNCPSCKGEDYGFFIDQGEPDEDSRCDCSILSLTSNNEVICSFPNEKPIYQQIIDTVGGEDKFMELCGLKKETNMYDMLSYIIENFECIRSFIRSKHLTKEFNNYSIEWFKEKNI